MFSVNERQAGFIEGYATALDDLLYKLTGESWSAKSYDPMTVDGIEMHSYAFSLKDGGRHHPLSDYKDIQEIKTILLEEVVEWLKGNYDIAEKPE